MDEQIAIPLICKESLRDRLRSIRTEEDKKLLRDFLIKKNDRQLAIKFKLLVEGSTHVRITFEDVKGCPFNESMGFDINW